ncbi:hypothetical protein [Kribbella sp. NPDC051770]|uniref:hypothetical protein n=1 Tax=Kribbella sp. NPDC051770 TaxID=3155413 RepID=UPI003445D446
MPSTTDPMPTEPRPRAPRPTAPPYVTRALVAGAIAAVSTGLAGAYIGEDVVTTIGNATNHHEPTLRLLGWSWIGLPLLLALWTTAVHERIRPAARPVVALALAIWAGSSALLIPGRRSSLEQRFGTAYPDARVLGVGWGAGLPSIFLIAAVTVAAILLLRQRATPRILTAAAALLGLAGLITALLAPLP